jgi:DNA mismatch repair ATPase MutS
MKVRSSLANKDSLERGESLYVAELSRMASLLRFAQAGDEPLVLVDEPFKGTNPLESTAVTAVLVAELASHARLIIATHQVILAPLLSQHLLPMKLVRHESTLALEEGVITETNGVRMLGAAGFPASIQERAMALAAWLSQYFLSPANPPAL